MKRYFLLKVSIFCAVTWGCFRASAASVPLPAASHQASKPPLPGTNDPKVLKIRNAAVRTRKARPPGTELEVDQKIRAAEDPQYAAYVSQKLEEEEKMKKAAREYADERLRAEAESERVRKEFVLEKSRAVVKSKRQDFLNDRAERRRYRQEQELARKQYVIEQHALRKQKEDLMRSNYERLPANLRK